MKPLIEIFKAFNGSAAQYDEVAVMQREVADRLLERISYLVMKPERVLEVGCGTGYVAQQLRSLFPTAQVLGLDGAWEMLQQAKNRSLPLVQANMMRLPFPKASMDLVVANQVLHWAPDRGAFLKEMARILKPGGCVFFSTLGPSTFQELREAWAQVDSYSHVASFVDMHTIGDELLAQRLSDPVMDREDLTLEYPSLKALLRHLKAQGVRHVDDNRRPGLMGRQAWQRFEALFGEGAASLSYELLYGHAWRVERAAASSQEVYIPITQLQRL